MRCNYLCLNKSFIFKLLVLLFYTCSIATTSDVNNTNLHSSRTGTGNFWQLTDIHWDLEYNEFGDKTSMCHSSSEMANASVGYFGNYLCDSPYPLVHSAFQTMKTIEPRPNFILWTGDNAPHTDDVDFHVIFKTLKNLTEELIFLFGADVPLIPVLGNHDAYPKDDYPPSGNSFYSKYLNEGHWDALLTQEAQKDFLKGGYFRVPVGNNVDVFVLNTNLYYKFNELGQELKDPGGQFQWMRDNFKDAIENERKVIIAAHAPPGYWERNPTVPFFNDSYNDEFVDILNEYGDSILAQIYGHEHTDSFRIFGTSHKNLKSVAFIAPSLTPWFPSRLPGGTAVNPSLRLYTYNSLQILDYVQFQLNLKEANNFTPKATCMSPNLTALLLSGTPELHTETVTQNVAPEEACKEPVKGLWNEYYRATNAYGASNLSVEEMGKVFERLKENETFFQEYVVRNSAGISHDMCNSTCRRGHLCAISHLKIESLIDCKFDSNNSHLSFSGDIDLSLTDSSSPTKDRTPLEGNPDHSKMPSQSNSPPTEYNNSYQTLSSTAPVNKEEDDARPHVAIGLVVGAVSLTLILGVMVLVIGGRRKKILNSASNISEFEWVNRQNGYRPLNSMEAD